MNNSSLNIDIQHFTNVHFYFTIFAGPCVLLNFYGLLVIYVATPPQMESFQRYILTVQYLGILNDLILSYGVFVIFSFPAWGLIPIGLFVVFGIPTQIELIIWFGCVTTFIAALLVALFQRQQAITPVDHWAKFSKRTVQVIELAVYLHPFYSVVPIIYYLFTLNDLNVAIQYNYESWPQLQQFYQSPSYWTMQGNIAEIFGHAIVGRYVNVILLVLIVLYIVIYWTLYKLRHIFSKRTLMLQKKWIRNLNIQMTAIFLMFFVPFVWLVSVWIHKNYDFCRYAPFPSIMMSLHSTVSTIVLLFSYDPYRNYTRNLLCSLFRKRIIQNPTESEQTNNWSATPVKNKICVHVINA